MLQTASLPNRLKAFYARVSVERDAALVELPELFTDDIHFMNPVVDQKGLVAFRQAWDKALRKYKVFEFHDVEVIGDGEQFSLTCSMTISFGFGPDFATDMATLCRVRDGKIAFLRDYFDPMGTLAQPLAPTDWIYKKVFGVLVA